MEQETAAKPAEAPVTQKPRCPLCGAEVDYFVKKKKSAWAQCPACSKKFLVKEHPELQPFIRVVEGAEESEEEGEAAGEKERERVSPPSLFEEPKPMEEIIAEVLEEWGCDKHFINTVVRYVNRKGFFDPNWLMGLLLQARTGRRFTPQEAMMVVDEIVSAIQREKERAEKMGRQYFGQIVWGYDRSPPQVYYPPAAVTPGQYVQPYAQPVYPYAPPPTSYTPPHQPPGYTPHQPPPHSYTPQPALTPQQVQEMIQRAFAEQRTKSDIDELKKMIFEIEKKRVEDMAALDKRLVKFMKATLRTVRETVSSVTSVIQQSQQRQEKPESGIDKKDIELMRSEMEKAFIKQLQEMEKKYTQQIQELEKKLVEAKSESEKKELVSRIEALQRQVEELRTEAGKPVSPEGWQRDETRLVAELGTRFLEMLDKRRPMEYLVRIVPYMAKPPKPEAKTEESLEEMIKAAGGEVE